MHCQHMQTVKSTSQTTRQRCSVWAPSPSVVLYVYLRATNTFNTSGRLPMCIHTTDSYDVDEVTLLGIQLS